MQYQYLLALAGLSFALPQEGGGQPAPQGGAPPQGGDMSGQMSQGGQMMPSQGGQAMPMSSGVPQDLSGGFKPDQISMQLSFTGDASQGVKDGAMVDQQQAMQEPKFALGDSSGVNTQAMWVIMMVDTTQQDQRMLHYVKSDYKATGQKTEIASQAQPKMQYMGPGMMGEQQGMRQYTFLMYQQKGEFQGMGMPEQGKPVVMQDFVKQNGLDKAVAGTSIMVEIKSMGGGGNSQMAQGGEMGGQMSGGQMGGEMGGQMSGGQMQGGEMGGQMSGGQMSGGQMQGGEMGGSMSAGGEMGGSMSAGGEMAGGAPAPGAPTPAAGGTEGGVPAAGGAPAGGEAGGASGAAGAPGAMATGSGMAGGMMNGSNPLMNGGTPGAEPTGLPPNPAVASSPAPSAPSSSPATGAAAATRFNAATLGLSAVGCIAVALF